MSAEVAKDSHGLAAVRKEIELAGGSERHARHAVNSILQWLLACKEPGAAKLVVDMLHGAHGPEVATAALYCFSKGFRRLGVVSQGNTNQHYSVVVQCMRNDTLAVFAAVAEAGPPALSMCSGNPAAWLDDLCATETSKLSAKLSALSSVGYVRSGAVEEVADFAGEFANARVAMDLIHRMRPEHPGFAALSKEPSKAGAFVRSYLMSKAVAEHAVDKSAAASVAQGECASSPRRRRAGV